MTLAIWDHTVCLPPNTSEHTSPLLQPDRPVLDLSTPKLGLVDIGDWLYTETVYPSRDGEQSFTITISVYNQDSKYYLGSTRPGVELCWSQVAKRIYWF